MKLKTALLLVASIVVIWVLYAFFNHEINSGIFASNFFFLGYSFSVLYSFLVAMMLAAVVPSLYFSIIYHRLLNERKHLEKGRSQSLQSRRNYEKARDLFHHGALDLVPETLGNDETPDGLLLKAKALRGSGDREGAVKLLRQCLKQEAPAEAAYLLVRLLEEVEQPNLDVLRGLVEGDPEHAVKAYGLLLDHYDRRGQWSACLETLQRMKDSGVPLPEGREAAYRYEWIRSRDNWPNKRIIEGYQQVLKEAPHFVPANLALGDTYMAEGSVEKAFRIYEQAFAQTRNPVFLDRLENFYLELGRPENAIQVYRELLVKLGGPLIKFQLGKLYFKLEMLDESLGVLEPLKGALGHIPGYLFYLAEIKARRDRMDEALGDLKQLVRQRGFEGQDFKCVRCETEYTAWQSRCEKCRRWDTITLEAGLVSAEAVSTAPLYY